jgi:hypothetical protein
LSFLLLSQSSSFICSLSSLFPLPRPFAPVPAPVVPPVAAAGALPFPLSSEVDAVVVVRGGRAGGTGRGRGFSSGSIELDPVVIVVAPACPTGIPSCAVEVDA